MASHESTFRPASRAGKWLDERLPLPRLMHGQFVDFPTPRNINYLWTTGGLLTFFLGVQIANRCSPEQCADDQYDVHVAALQSKPSSGFKS